MDLWVRSQDKEVLIKANKIKYENYKPFWSDYYIEAITINDREIIQEYKTKERALEVLDDIQKYIERGFQQYVDTGDYYTSEYAFKVYEMPKE
jgi:hypothetical protein